MQFRSSCRIFLQLHSWNSSSSMWLWQRCSADETRRRKSCKVFEPCTAAAALGCTLVSVSRCAKVVQKLYQSKFHSKYLGYPRASQFVFIFSCSTHTRPYLFEAVNCFQKNVQELEPYIALDVIFRPFPPPFCTSGPSRLQPIAFLLPLWPQN